VGKTACTIGLILGFASVLMVAHAAGPKSASPAVRLDSLEGLQVIDGKAAIETYLGRRAVRLSSLTEHAADASTLAILSGTDFKDGTIELDVAGAPGKGADAGNRGFVGLAFRVQGPGSRRAEYFYLRPTNGRADDQLRRNHSVQYESEPDFRWNRLRKENPGAYESYADIQPAVWIKMKIVVSGTKARLYLNGAAQPCLVVNDLKLGETHGPIALWAFWGTDAYFSNLKVR